MEKYYLGFDLACWYDVENTFSNMNIEKTDLWAAVQSTWKSILFERYDTLFSSMPRRCRSVINNKEYSI